MKIITTTFDGHINSLAFNSWDEARTYVLTRIPIEGCYQKFPSEPFWTTFEYLEESSEGIFKKHCWKLNEVSVKTSKSS